MKGERLQIRCDDRAKDRIELAAAFERKSISAFVTETVLERADRVIADHEREALSEPDWAVFFAALAEPPNPNRAMRATVARYAARSGNAR
jgi:uncharacterized protein (DUF1778 family)